MLTYPTLQDRPREFLAATGLTHDECARVLPAFAAAYALLYPPDKTWEGKVRQRQGGGGAKGVLPQMEDKLFFILVYQKTNPLQTMHGLQFDLSQPQTNYWIHRLLPVLQRALAALGMAPERDASRVATSPLALEGAPDEVIDGTERRRQRPRIVKKSVPPHNKMLQEAPEQLPRSLRQSSRLGEQACRRCGGPRLRAFSPHILG